ncbi:hemolysin III family protein [Deferribacter autotrophicus]|uniref:Hemolysin III family protein n=1 Tax=Deferribacter autotrophicus TaxID=500465 RepID=A0A5A8F1U9_9BACT|nr:hemolysin III family protein [Deferribacter autotrophicus]KAA0257372.1 hemolysin III family protein [Deferribacter autotrophicus]
MKLKIREPVNAVTHLIGSLFSIASFYLLVSDNLPFYKKIAFSIYALGMFLSFTSSFIFHSITNKEKLIFLLKKIDHIMIYIFIAASYTPISLIVLEKKWGISIFVTVWIIAIIGILIEILFKNIPRNLSTANYLLMGWTAIVAIYPLYTSLPPNAFFLLVLGGIFYTVGAVIYAVKKPNILQDVLGFHEIFHLFVLIGSFTHFLLMFFYIKG